MLQPVLRKRVEVLASFVVGRALGFDVRHCDRFRLP